MSTAIPKEVKKGIDYQFAQNSGVHNDDDPIVSGTVI